MIPFSDDKIGKDRRTRRSSSSKWKLYHGNRPSIQPSLGIRDRMCRARLRTIFPFIKLTSLTRNPSIYTSISFPPSFLPDISISNCVVRVFKVGLTIMTNLFRGLCGNDTNYMHFPVTMRTFNSIRGLSLSRLGIVEFLTPSRDSLNITIKY